MFIYNKKTKKLLVQFTNGPKLETNATIPDYIKSEEGEIKYIEHITNGSELKIEGE